MHTLTQQNLQNAKNNLETIAAELSQDTLSTLLTALEEYPSLESAPANTQLSAERRQVTIMFADISGFTAMSEKLDPEDVRNTINHCFDLLGEAIARYGGYIDKFIGDEIMALFGAPVAHENDPERALRAALDMMTALDNFNLEFADRIPKPLALHFGINTGLVIAGGIGTNQRQDYSVMGDAVNLAARLEDLSESGEILVGTNTYRLTEPLFEFESLKPVRLKGKAKPVQVYRLLKARSNAAGQVRGIEGLYSPIVGRYQEIEKLEQLLTGLQHGQGGTVSVIGEAGLGKSRLTSELRHLCSISHLNTQWVQGHALSYAENVSYLIARTLIRSMLGLNAEASHAEMRQLLWAELTELLPTRSKDLYPYLAHLLDIPLDHETEHRLSYLDGSVMQQRVIEATQHYLQAMAQQMPIGMIWDDLHWADPSSLDLLAALLPLTQQYPLLLILIYRPIHHRQGWQFHDKVGKILGEAHTVLNLKPITPEESHALLNNLLGDDCLPTNIQAQIVGKAEGNPFFIEEVIRGLINQEIIQPAADGKSWYMVGDVAEITIPDSLQGVIMARIDSLPPEMKRVLQIASVMGRAFNYNVLAQLMAEVD